MGADGHWALVKKEEWNAAFPDVKPFDCGCSVQTVLGIEAITCYWDTEGRDAREYGKQALAEKLAFHEGRLKKANESGGIYNSDFMKKLGLAPITAAKEKEQIAAIKDNPELDYSRRCLEAMYWFEAKAEEHQVWT